MKKVLSILLVCVILSSFASCAFLETKEASNDLENAANDFAQGNIDAGEFEDSIENYASAIDGNVQGFTDINKYVENIIKSDIFKQSVQSTKELGMILELEADGNNLVYKYTYTVPVADNAAELIENSFEASSSTYDSTANAIRIEAPCVEKVIWSYYDIDGNLIYSYEK